MSYFDRGFTLIQVDTRHENYPYISALYEKLSYLNGGYDVLACLLMLADLNRYTGKWDTFPNERSPHLSHDNVLGLYELDYLARSETGKEVNNLLPIINFNGRYYLHPQGWMIFLGYRSRFLKKLFYPFLYLMFLFSKYTRKRGETSCVLLWWLRGFQMYDNKTMYDHFEYYITNAYRYNNLNNPLLYEARRYFLND